MRRREGGPASAAFSDTPQKRMGRSKEVRMRILRLALSRAIALWSVVLILATGGTSFAQAPATAPLAYPPPLITLAEARAIIEGAIAYAREGNMRMAVVVVDHAGNVLSGDRMDGAALQNIRFAEGKAFASALYRQTTEAMGELYKTRPDRYFGIMNMYPGKVYLVGGGVPLALEGQLVGGVGVAGLPQGVDEKSARAGIDAWMKFRATMKK
jgi:uncharacterized protein GlcG (DUF336 family)